MLTTVPGEIRVKHSLLLRFDYCLSICSSCRSVQVILWRIWAFMLQVQSRMQFSRLLVSELFRGLIFLRHALLSRSHAGDWWQYIRKKQPIPEYNWLPFIMVVMSHVVLWSSTRLTHQSLAGWLTGLLKGSGSGEMASSAWACTFKLFAYAAAGILLRRPWEFHNHPQACWGFSKKLPNMILY